ncbi:Lipoprotein Rz1 precursor [compost metagenome]
MRKTTTFACSALLTMVVSGCASKPPAQPQCPPIPAPAAWLMQEPPNSQQTLDRIISPSGTNSP